jgi:hypothetical protein
MTPTPDVGALKPCPFCGNPPATGHSSDGHTWIACETKGCGLAETYMSKDHDAVLAMWNRRDATALQALEARATAAEARIKEIEALLKAEGGLLVDAPAMAVEERTRAEASEAKLAEHRERWQRLVNEIAGAFNNGMVVGDDAESIENAIGLIQAAARLLEAAEADLAAFNKFVVVCDDENSTLEQANEAHLAYQETSTAVRAAVAALQAAGSGEGNTMTLPPDDVQPSHWKPLPARPGAQEDDTHG